MKKLLADIEAYLARTGMPAVWFGPCIGLSRQFVTDLRQGVSTSVDNADKARTFMRKNASAVAAEKAVSDARLKHLRAKVAKLASQETAE